MFMDRFFCMQLLLWIKLTITEDLIMNENLIMDEFNHIDASWSHG